MFPAALEEAVTTVLWEMGTSGTEALPGAAGENAVIAYFLERDGLQTALTASLRSLNARAVPTDVPDVDWVARFRDGFRRFRVGSFEIVPVWETSPPAADPRVLVVDPGLAFGTGTHETTALCLAALEERAAAVPLRDVADVGCGSGILGIAALRLGARRVVGVDLDAEALPAARDHARLNGAPVRLVRGDGGRALAAGAFDVVVANLMTALLLERRDELAALRRPSGAVLLLSGLLASDVPEVTAAYGTLGAMGVRTRGEWALVSVAT